ncbi:hypothetical protein [Enterovibrio paralichthyis]|uniref:hypothetical protein n=1 Tax=Enterovibrio paralichthyis TaxID=2853805 RepID=UPI001C4388CD|nr:hypothetical protein [Enterovibrio paralichthyis]MBV7300762.1 hypothetical protein [Enterovibrio paralichthyis]
MNTADIEILKEAVLKSAVSIRHNSAGQTTVSCRYCSKTIFPVRPPISAAIKRIAHDDSCPYMIAQRD